MPQIPLLNAVIDLNDKRVSQAAFVVNSPGAWLPAPEVIGQRPSSSKTR
jgi:hypothetical protein